MPEKVKSWWSEDGKWFCLLVNDGANQATVSLTPDEAHKLARRVVANDPLTVSNGHHDTPTK